MIRILWGFLFFIPALLIVLVVIAIPYLLLLVLGRKKASDAIAFAAAALLANMILFLAGVRVHLSGNVDYIRQRIDEGEGFCFVSNHTSILDIVAMLGKVRIRAGYIAKKELLFVPVINLVIAMVHSVFIDRSSMKKGIQSIRKATAKVRSGYSMVIYPEGTRSKDGKLGTFKPGSFRIATDSGARIVPVTVKGLRQSFEDRRHMFQTADCYINIGDPIDSVSSSDRDAVKVMIQGVEDGIRTTYERLG